MRLPFLMIVVLHRRNLLGMWDGLKCSDARPPSPPCFLRYVPWAALQLAFLAIYGAALLKHLWKQVGGGQPHACKPQRPWNYCMWCLTPHKEAIIMSLPGPARQAPSPECRRVQQKRMASPLSLTGATTHSGCRQATDVDLAAQLVGGTTNGLPA